MLQYPAINPIAFSLGPLAVHWYGLMYLIGFVAAWFLLNCRIKRNVFTRHETESSALSEDKHGLDGRNSDGISREQTSMSSGSIPSMVRTSLENAIRISASQKQTPSQVHAERRDSVSSRGAKAVSSSRCWTRENISDIIFYGALGVILGGRIGYILFYNFSEFLHSPLILFKIWQGGMSFHGGLIGVIVAMLWYSRKIHCHPADLTDFIAPVVPIGLGAGRIGNFINGELWGRVTDMPWGMIYPDGGALPRHPSELYEFLLEGVLFFIILWWYSSKPRPRYAVSGLFLLGYGVFRFCVEFFREPDSQLGYLFFNWVTMGQILCLPMIVIGAGMIVYAYRKVKN